jgi:hypothetical protein
MKLGNTYISDLLFSPLASPSVVAGASPPFRHVEEWWWWIKI